MKLLSFGLAVTLLLACSAYAQAPTTQAWLGLVNDGREEKLAEGDVIFAPAPSETEGGLVAVGFRQSDGTVSLGNVIWQGKAWTPLAGFAQILAQRGFAEATDQERQEMFYQLLRQANEPLGTFPYNGPKSREQTRPQPVSGYRQADGYHRFTVWFCEEPGRREGPEWREVLYLVNIAAPTVQARTLSSFHPSAEGLRDFPPIPAKSSE